MVEQGNKKAVLLADAALFVTAMLWGSGFGTTNWLLKFMSPLWLLSVRFLLSTALLGLIFRSRLSLLSRKDVFWDACLEAFWLQLL